MYTTPAPEIPGVVPGVPIAQQRTVGDDGKRAFGIEERKTPSASMNFVVPKRAVGFAAALR
jgi:hypothetical protein